MRHAGPSVMLSALPHSRALNAGRRAIGRASRAAPLYSLQTSRSCLSRSLVVAHSREGDRDPYQALSKVADLSWAAARSAPVAKLGRGAVLIVPLVVVDGCLLASEYSTERKRFCVHRRKIGHLLWSGPRLPPTQIDVVELSCLPSYVKLLQSTRDELFTLATERLRALPSRLAARKIKTRSDESSP